jgi:hypothetical protein
VNPAPNVVQNVEYQKIRGDIQTGDILLFRGSHPLSKVIEGISGSPYSHVAFLTKWDDRVIALQSDLRGVEVIPASMLVCRYEGKVEWWRLAAGRRNGFDSRDFLNRALTLIGIKYGYLSLIWVGIRMMLGLSVYRKFSHVRPSSLFCSSFVSYCYMNEGIAISAKAGVDGTSPADFANSGIFEQPHQLFDGSNHEACSQLLATQIRARNERIAAAKKGSFWNGKERRDPRERRPAPQPPTAASTVPPPTSPPRSSAP